MRALLVLAVFLFPAACYAGAEQEFVCRHCGLKVTYVLGGLMFAGQYVAYCPTDHLVYISWDYRKRPPKPVRYDGNAPVFICPACKKSTARRWDEKECPRCGSKNIRIRSTGLMVD